MKPTLITNARLIDPASNRDEIGSILFDAAILDIGPRISAPNATSLDAQGACVMPGLIDLRVVVGEPGAEHKETFKSAGRAAVAGGVTTFVMAPNTKPVLDDASLIDFVLHRAPERSPARILPAAALTRGLAGETMTEMGLLKEAGAVMFSNGDAPITDSRVLRRALSYSTAFDALVAHRPEDSFLAGGGAMHEGELAARLGLPGIPAAAEFIAAERDLALAELTGARLLLDMISSARTLESISRAKDRGVKASASVSVHHIALNEQDVDGYRTYARLSPPLRSEVDRAALAEAISSGHIDIIVSGHDPRPAEEKRLPFSEAAPGAAALELLLPGALTLHHNGAASIIDVVRAMTANPAKLLGLKQGRLAKGAPADIILVDLDAPFQVSAAKLKSKSKNTPFDEKLMQGRVRRTYVAGACVYEDEK